jgi:hypothetical protein
MYTCYYKLHEGDSFSQKVKNRQFTEVSFANLTLEGEGDTFRSFQAYRANVSERRQRAGTATKRIG